MIDTKKPTASPATKMTAEELDKLEALALGYVYENGEHWYCLPQIADGITYEPAANFITGVSPAAILSLIAQARAAAKEPAVLIASVILRLIAEGAMDWHAGPTGDPEEDAFHSDDEELRVLVDLVNKARAAAPDSPHFIGTLDNSSEGADGIDWKNFEPGLYYVYDQPMGAAAPAAQAAGDIESKELDSLLFLYRSARAEKVKEARSNLIAHLRAALSQQPVQAAGVKTWQEAAVIPAPRHRWIKPRAP